MRTMITGTFTKHEGLGNDFLVLLDVGGDVVLSPERVRHLCERRRGIGADGLLRATRPRPAPGEAGGGSTAPGEAADAVMELFNADGSRAEMSGNGIRCLAQAVLLAGWVEGPGVAISTDAGLRRLTLVGGPVAAPTGGVTHHLEVGMGRIEPGGAAPAWALPRGRGPEPARFRARWASTGNPHLVLEVGDPAEVTAVDLAELGEKVNADVPGGANVHLVAPGPGPGRVTARTYERGVGLTEACGTGACAAAVVATRWGMIEGGSPVVVAMPGGEARVTPGPGEDVTLTGPATTVAAVEHPWPADA